ncbi:hypothetical protein ASPWEDRAFT_177597 [Aspergillus wentii DTO 134E9]|uniref:Uncharacterized protein n=1 Tax=Aspergillus wentii DTO 134E9 TaxID=1073089 RepID=A0A1L9R4Q1_ASPWE|nr:uncharacterized protein ASPWEDRAFT_177597 [Aspergillus wentii DTO 134E9]KAI9927136.1 hypothetical protein MW887_003519 [Aspergillus wentii]OJJ29863.1 hypothetical protein ASPWEDRAFT_177597 [Aspergillus wentii DTO 134E9]
MEDHPESVSIGSISPKAYQVPAENEFTFTTLKKSIDSLEEKYESHVHQGGSQYVALTNLSEEHLEVLEREREKHYLPHMRVHYYPNHTNAIIKFAERRHETATAAFRTMITRILDSLQISETMLLPGGAGRQRMGSGTSKEPDHSWIPLLTRPSDEFPSFVVEIGIGEVLSRLRVDAGIWFDSSNGLARLVLLIAVDVEQKTIRIERWQSSQCVQVVTINKINQTVSNAPLILPIDLIFDDRIPLPDGSPSASELLSIPAASLLHYADVVFA